MPLLSLGHVRISAMYFSGFGCPKLAPAASNSNSNAGGRYAGDRWAGGSYAAGRGGEGRGRAISSDSCPLSQPKFHCDTLPAWVAQWCMG